MLNNHYAVIYSLITTVLAGALWINNICVPDQWALPGAMGALIMARYNSHILTRFTFLQSQLSCYLSALSSSPSGSFASPKEGQPNVLEAHPFFKAHIPTSVGPGFVGPHCEAIMESVTTFARMR